MMEIGTKVIKQVLELKYDRMESHMKEIGKRIYDMVMDVKLMDKE